MDILLIVAVVIVIVILVAIIASSSGTPKSEWKVKAKSQLDLLYKSIKSNNYIEVKAALIDLDKLLDFILKSKNINGTTLGERLKNSRNIFSKEDYNAVWTAHKLRNELVHEIENKASINAIRHNANVLFNILKKHIN